MVYNKHRRDNVIKIPRHDAREERTAAAAASTTGVQRTTTTTTTLPAAERKSAADMYAEGGAGRRIVIEGILEHDLISDFCFFPPPFSPLNYIKTSVILFRPFLPEYCVCVCIYT